MPTTNSLATQMKHRDRDMVPKVLVQAMFTLMVAAVVLVGYARLTDRPVIGVAPHSDIVARSPITLVGTGVTGSRFWIRWQQIAHSNDHKAGFIDVIWVTYHARRIVQDTDTQAPLRLVRRENGHVAILDDTTGWSIELIGYGQDNVAAFAKLID